MRKIKVTENVMAELLKNAERCVLETAATATTEQIEEARRQNDLFDRGFEICLNCRRESSLESENCELCGADKLPF